MIYTNTLYLSTSLLGSYQLIFINLKPTILIQKKKLRDAQNNSMLHVIKIYSKIRFNVLKMILGALTQAFYLVSIYVKFQRI